MHRVEEKVGRAIEVPVVSMQSRSDESTQKLLPNHNYSTEGKVPSSQVVEDDYEEDYNNDETQEQV